MSFSDLKFLQYVNAANAAVYRCGITPTNVPVRANSLPPSELDIQTALTCISNLYTYMKNNTPTVYASFTSAQYQNLWTYLNMPVNRNGPTIVLGPNNASSIGALANNYLTRPIETVGYFAQTGCVDFALPAVPQVACNNINQPTCTFADALGGKINTSAFGNAYLNMCEPNIQNTMDNLYKDLVAYNIIENQKFLPLSLPAIAKDIIAFVSAVTGATDGYLSLLYIYLTTPLTAGTTDSLFTLSQAAVAASPDINGLTLALFQLGEQYPNGGGALKGMITVCTGDTVAKNSKFSGEYGNATYCPQPLRNCWFNDLDHKWHTQDLNSPLC